MPRAKGLAENHRRGAPRPLPLSVSRHSAVQSPFGTPMIAPLTPLDFLARSASVFRDSPAVTDGGLRLTYSEFQARVHRLAAALQSAGVGPGDRVAVLAFNGAAALEAHFGPMLIGAVVVMLNTRLASDELLWILKNCGAKVLIVDPELLHLVESAPIEHIVSDYEKFLSGAPAIRTPWPVVEDEN